MRVSFWVARSQDRRDTIFELADFTGLEARICIEDELAAIARKLSELEREKAALLSRRSELHATAQRTTATQLSPNQKAELFRNLFRGRQDIYAVRWQGSGGRSGYAVACENEWVPGICQKPRIKCGECPHKKFKPLDFNTVYDHLSGKHVAGLYPLLPDSSCYLLAVDFDKEDWRADVRALAQACRDEGIPYLVEISGPVRVPTYGSSFRTAFRPGPRGPWGSSFWIKPWKATRACHSNLMTGYSPTRTRCPTEGLAI